MALKLVTIFVLIIISGGCYIGPSLKEKKIIPFAFNEDKSQVFKAGGPCKNTQDDFILKGDFSVFERLSEVTLIKSWEEYKEFREHDIDSPIFNNMNEIDFENAIAGVVIVVSTGSEKIYSEKFIKTEDGYYFAYKVSQFAWFLTPKCEWHTLFLFKLVN